MMINQINGNLAAGLLSVKTDGLRSSSFNRVLTEMTASLSEKLQRIDGRIETPHTASEQNSGTGKLVKIGTITSKNPTVSNLLIRNPEFKKECWNIIHNGRNEGKEYRCIRTGTDIYINPDTKELLWGDMIEKNSSAPVVADTPQSMAKPEAAEIPRSLLTEKPIVHQASTGSGEPPDRLSESLVKAIEPMIGETYSDINCFELLVSGLSRLGIRYGGRGGLGRKLMARAMDNGLPMNAYLNGEGLIEFSGSKVYGKSFFRVSDPAGQARKVIEEMAPHLEKGSILSFSTESRGHTGIVSSKNGAWTYINSGVMDNPVSGTLARKGVGEEKLNQEIENWFQLAARRNESLVITLGRLNPNKLAAFEKNREQMMS